MSPVGAIAARCCETTRLCVTVLIEDVRVSVPCTGSNRSQVESIDQPMDARARASAKCQMPEPKREPEPEPEPRQGLAQV